MRSQFIPLGLLVLASIPGVFSVPSSKLPLPDKTANPMAHTPFTVNTQIQNIKIGSLLNAQNNYFAAPQQADGSGLVQGHSHVVIQSLADLRDGGTQSYAQFANFCSLSRRDFHLYRRALADGNHRMAAHYLVKRRSCAPAKKGGKAIVNAAGDKKPKLTMTTKALGGLTAGAKKSALTPGAKKSTLTAGAKNPKLSTTFKSLGHLAAGAKKSALTAKKLSAASKSTKAPKLTKLTPGPKGKLSAAKNVAGVRKPPSKIASARKPASKSPTGNSVASAKFGVAGVKKLSAGKKLTTAKSPPKGTSGAGAKKVADPHTAKSLAKGASRASTKKFAGARKSPSMSLTKEANHAGAKKDTLTKFRGIRKPALAGAQKGKGAMKGIASPQNLKKAVSLTATVASKAGKKGRG